MKKTLFIDTNISNPDGSYFVNERVIISRGLKIGDEVTAYQEGEEWDAVVTYTFGTWGVAIRSSCRAVSDEKQVAYGEGFWEGYYCQLSNLSKVLGQVDIPQDKIEYIVKKMHNI